MTLVNTLKCFMENPVIQLIDELDTSRVSNHRKGLLKPLLDYLSQKIKQKAEINLNFICTHNSRRSQLSQLWAKVISDFYGLNINTFSGGIEVTACNERTISSFKRMGLSIINPGGMNPRYEVKYHESRPPAILFSKIYSDDPNPKHNFAAVMTCAHADENCPFIPGAETRISLPYEDPKVFDDSPDEAKMYDQRSIQIATEMKYVLSTILS